MSVSLLDYKRAVSLMLKGDKDSLHSPDMMEIFGKDNREEIIRELSPEDLVEKVFSFMDRKARK